MNAVPPLPAPLPDVQDARTEQIQRNQAAIQLLESWCNVGEDDAREQRETLEYLKRMLDEDRLSNRKLFP